MHDSDNWRMSSWLVDFKLFHFFYHPSARQHREDGQLAKRCFLLNRGDFLNKVVVWDFWTINSMAPFPKLPKLLAMRQGHLERLRDTSGGAVGGSFLERKWRRRRRATTTTTTTTQTLTRWWFYMCFFSSNVQPLLDESINFD